MKANAPLSKVQYGIYVECVAHQGEACYNLPYLYVLDGSLDGERLCRAIEAAVKAHPTLFTRILLDESGEAQQSVDNTETFSLRVEPVEDIESVKQQLIVPFNIYKDRLFHIRLLQDGMHYYLFLDIHHLIGDGTTLKVMLSDIETAYNGGELAPEQMTMAEVAMAEAELRQTPAFEEGKQWYAQHFDCSDTFTQLIPDLDIEEHAEASLVRTLDVDMADVDKFCKDNGIFKSNFFTTAYSYLLAKYNNEQESLFFTIYNGRSDKRFLHSVGMTVKSLPVYAKFDDKTTVLDYLKEGQEQMSGCRKHEAYAFSDAVNDLGLQSNSTFAWHGMMFADEQLCGKPMKTIRLCNSTLEASLYLKAFILNGHYQVKAEYNSNEYSEPLISQFLESYEAVVKGFLTEKMVSNISITTDQQLALLDSFNQNDVDYDNKQTIITLFRRQVKATPDNIAVIYQNHRYTYAEVDELSDRIAGYVASKGLGREDVVSVLIPRSEWMAIASLGVLKAGCGYQPLDASYPKERLNFMMQDASVQLLITDEELRDIVNEYQGDVLLTKDLMQLPKPTILPEGPEPSSLFIMLYTSGSTGVPKGCQLMHSNLVAFCHWHQRFYHLDGKSRLATYASYGFDACMMDMYPTLTSGATLYIIPEEIRLDFMALSDYFEREHITHSFMTTQVGHQFATSIENHSLKYLSMGGEKMAGITPPQGVTLCNLYGPTETTVLVTAYQVKHKMREIPIGQAIDNVRLYIVDAQGHRLSVGAAGELWVAGPQVSRGYLNRPEKTAEVFITNPFTNEEKYNRVYKTGDIVRYLPDGNIQFVGRKDGQVKIRGFRIELKEVESIIREFPSIKDATVQAFDEEGGNGKFIAAYIVSDQKIDIEALNAFILDEKPPYMVPAVTMQIDAIPLNQNQKVNKKALPKPEKQVAAEDVVNAPLNALEQELHDLIAAIVGHQNFGVTTVLGYAGLTSISAIKLAVQVNKKYGVVLDSKKLVKTFTLQTIENEIWHHVMAGGTCAAEEAQAPSSIQGKSSVPLSHAQAGVYVDCMNNQDSTIYNIPMKIALPHTVDIETLAKAVTDIVRSHPQLSVHFDNSGEETVQVTAPQQKVVVPVSQMSEEELNSYKHDFVKPFNLNEGPLYRLEIVDTGEHVYLLTDFHHLVADGASYDLFLRQLCSVLDGEPLEQERLSYAAFVMDEKATEKTKEYADAKAFFDERLGGVDGSTEIPADLSNPMDNGILCHVATPIDILAAETFCNTHGITPAHLFLAATYYTLSRYVNSEQICITTISNGRSDVRIANTMGMFVNTLALSAEVKEQRVIDFIQETGENFRQTLSHERYPFTQMATDYGLTPEIMYAYQLGVIDSYPCQGGQLEIENLELEVPKVPIGIFVKDDNGQPSIFIEYDNGRYSQGLVQQLANAISEVAAAFISHPEQSLLSVSLLNDTQTAQLDSFNDTDELYDDQQTVVSLFRRQAKATPEKTAVVFRDKRFTYAEVDDISERIACYVAGKGLGLEDIVAILIPRCEWMAIASLGVLKAGCAFQPLDASYPKERLNFMLQDTGAKLLIADAELRDLVDEYHGDVLLTKDLMQLPKTDVKLSEPKPESLFTLIYTSGSTGVPKGGQSEHRNWVSFFHTHLKNCHITAESRVGAYASFGFDASPQELFATLVVGAELHIIPEELRLDLIALNNYFEKNGITHGFMTTQVAFQFVTSIDNHSLEVLITGGEKLASLEPPKSYQLMNAYGPSETICYVATYFMDAKLKNIPIGSARTNIKLYIVDKQGHRLPIGASGELWVAGPQVTRGYLNRPEKTAEVFIQNPFSSEEKYRRVYRTGDIVRYLPDGNIQFVGRRDGQVKIRGFRVELKEVETVIREFPGIKDATVQAFDEEGGNGKFIAAYIVSDEPIDIEALNNFILDEKPPYMVPAVTMQIDAIPLNQNQKVNKKALPKPEATPRTKVGGGQAAPLNVLENEIMDIVSQVVSTSDFGITDRLVDLGLTSITSIKLAVKLFDRFGIQLKARQLVVEGSIQFIENQLLTSMMNQEAVSAAPPEGSEEETTAEQSCPLSFTQQGVYSECQANPDSVQYNIPFALRFPQDITAAQLEAAVRKVVEAHPYILCHFVADSNNEIIQKPMPDVTLEIPIKSLSAGDLDSYKKTFVRPFDLTHGPCFRFEIIESDTLWLLADMNHLVSDGASIDIFLHELCAVLDGSPVEKESYNYYDFVHDEQISPETEQFFAQQMAEVEEATQLIPDIFEPNLPHTEKEVKTPTDFKAVKAFAQKNGVTPASVYLAACYIAFGRFVCEDTVAIATISNGRSNLKVSNTMGMFVNTLPLVTTLDHHEPTIEFLRRVSQNFSDTIDHENYPFARIASKYDFRPQASYTYQIGVLSDYNTRYGKVDMEQLTLDIAKVPVAVYIVGAEQEAAIKVAYDSAMYSAAMMTSLAESIRNVVCGLLTCENCSQISMTDERQWQVLDSYNKPWDLDYDTTDSVVTRFKKVVAQYPDKTAAVFKDKAYTYRQLDEVTDSLAAKIYQIGCEVTGKSDLREEVVAIILSRNEQTFILPLAAVKAGMGYEPLDPSYPQERLNFMVKDAGVCLLLADDDLRDVVDEYEGKTVTVSELYAMQEAHVTPVSPTPQNLFVMLYTSGSTGAPKGCQIENGNIVALAYGTRHSFYTRDDHVASYASFSFDVNMADVFCSLLVGGTVHLVPEEVRMNLDRLANFFDESGITTLLLTTQVGVQFLQNYPKRKTLRLLVMGGEKLPAVDPSGLSFTIANGYGPTENCCGVSIFPIQQWEPNIPIGKPVATIHAFVLDKTNHRLPAGAAGEYCLSGPQVSRGYLNRPDKTAEAYEPCPFNEFRMYHTGDIVRYRQSGDVEFVGRKDGQVKIRGFRIETKEVEAVIRGFEGIRDVTVQAYDYESGGKYLVAFVVSDHTVDTNALADYIKSQKPAYMVPAVIMQIDQIPLTVNQKVDKKALPKPERKAAEYIAPANKTEEDFCHIFEQILGLDKVSADADFFEIGGSSIIAMKVVITAEKAGYKIVYNDVFSYTTAQAMAEFLGAAPEESVPTVTAPADLGTWAPPVVGPDGYDYSRIHELLSRNTMEAFRNGERHAIGDVLLLGATGYLGSHVLNELIENHDGKIYCFVRPGKDANGEKRLKDIHHYYFGDKHDALFGQRIFVIEGDATDAASLQQFRAPHSDMTAINCAASVKHFAKGNEIDRINVESVRNLAAWCEANDARLLHISTASVMGNRRNGLPPVSYQFTEQVLYAGQEIDSNQYVHSKFMAERHIYEEILHHGLKAKVCRVGNLAPRSVDGQFQRNYDTNNFMNNLKAYNALGVVSYDALNVQTEFSPIDCVAKAVVALAQTPDDCICFMPLNTHRPLMGDIIRTMNNLGYNIHSAENEEVGQALQQALADEKTSAKVNSMMAYKSDANLKAVGLESLDISHTSRILARLGFQWAETGSAYMQLFLDGLAKKRFFE